MKLTCTSCSQLVQIDDAKVPEGLFKIKCPKCGKIITASKDAASAPPPAAAATSSPPAASAGGASSDNSDEISPALEAFVRREVSQLKRELTGAIGTLFSGGASPAWGSDETLVGESTMSGMLKRALVCEDEQVFLDLISQSLRRLGYSVDVARSSAEAIKKIDTNFYSLVTVDYVFPDDKEGGNKILGKINGQKPAQRRQQFVVLISSTVKSADANAAFFHGANIVVNKEEIKNLEAQIAEGQRNFQQIYSVYNKLLSEKNERL